MWWLAMKAELDGLRMRIAQLEWANAHLTELHNNLAARERRRSFRSRLSRFIRWVRGA